MSPRLKSCLAVFLVALVIRGLAVGLLWPSLKPDANWDYYRELGHNLAAGKGFVATANGQLLPNVMRTPGYPLFLAALIKLGGDHLAVFLAANCLLGALTCALTVLLAAYWVRLEAATIAGLIAAIDPNSIMRCATVMTDTLFALLLIAGLTLVVWRRSWLWLGLLWSAATLCRPIAIWLWVGVALVILVQRHRPIGFALFLLGFLPLLGVWTARNHQLTGHWFYSTTSTYQSVVCWATGVEAAKTGRPAETVQREYLDRFGDLEFYDGPELFNQRLENYRRTAREVLRPAPLLVFKEAALGWGKLLFGPGQRTLEMWQREPPRPARWWPPLYILSLAALVALSLVGTFRLRFAAVWLVGVAAYFVVLGGGPATNSRFRCPIIPVLATLAVAAFPRSHKS